MDQFPALAALTMKRTLEEFKRSGWRNDCLLAYMEEWIYDKGFAFESTAAGLEKPVNAAKMAAEPAVQKLAPGELDLHIKE
jgi:hypothetical protein